MTRAAVSYFEKIRALMEMGRPMISMWIRIPFIRSARAMVLDLTVKAERGTTTMFITR